MPLPAWAHPTHPIVQRELAVWSRYRPGLRLAGALVGLAFGLSLVSDVMTIAAPDAFGYLFLYIQSLPSAPAILALKALLLAMSASSIVRDREAQVWEALQLTGLSPRAMVAGRAAAIVRLLGFPILCWIVLNVTLTSIFLFRRLFATRFEDLDVLPNALFFLAAGVLVPCAVVALHLALGLLISTLAVSQARALAAATALLGGLVVWGWLSGWIDQRLRLTFTLGAIPATLLTLGWTAGLAFACCGLAERRVAGLPQSRHARART